MRPDQKNGEGVISLRSAGDISLGHRQTPRRGLILPHREAGFPPTIIPLRYLIHLSAFTPRALTLLSLGLPKKEKVEITRVLTCKVSVPDYPRFQWTPADRNCLK